MSAPRLGGLAVLALALVALAVWFGRHGVPQSESPSHGLLWPELSEGSGGVERLEILAADATAPQVLERVQGQWRVAGHGGWWADQARVEMLLRDLGRARKLEAKTAIHERHGLLGVADAGSGEGAGDAVDLTRAGTTRRLLVGRANPHSSGRFVRFADESQAWLVDAALDLPDDPRQWLDRELLDVASRRIARLEIRPGEGAAIVFVRTPGEGVGHRLVGAPGDRDVAEDRVEEALTLFEGLRLEHVKSDPGIDAGSAADPIGVRMESLDGLVLVAQSWNEGEARWVRLRVEFDLPAARGWVDAEIERDQAALDAARQPALDSGEAAAAPLDAATAGIGPMDPEERLEALQAEAVELGARLEGWVFSLPPRKRAIIESSRDQYFPPAD